MAVAFAQRARGTSIMKPRTYERHYEESVTLPVGAQEVFSYADDFSKLSSHMNKPSSMMMGGSMETLLDEGRGQSIGSHVRMKGKMMGVELLLDEVITERQPPHHKAWETIGRQRLLVIDSYRDQPPMGKCRFRIGSQNGSP